MQRHHELLVFEDVPGGDDTVFCSDGHLVLVFGLFDNGYEYEEGGGL